jgi:hypothetical protein
MLTRRSINLVLFALLVLAGVAVGCKPPTSKPARLTDEQVNQIAENILQAINSGDYVAFSKDFSDAMAKASTETEYNKLRSLLLNTSGRYISKTKPTLSNIQTIAVYDYVCQFDREKVVFRVTFQIGGNKVEGTFFDSTNIRKSNP